MKHWIVVRVFPKIVDLQFNHFNLGSDRTNFFKIILEIIAKWVMYSETIYQLNYGQIFEINGNNIPSTILGAQQTKSTKHNSPVCNKNSCSLFSLSVNWPNEEDFFKMAVLTTIPTQTAKLNDTF